MKGRLLVVNPQQATGPARSPSMILEEDGHIGYYQDGWTRRISAACLESVTEEDIRCSLRVRPDDVICLSPVRELPSNDLMSPGMLQWMQDWWAEFAAELQRREPVRAAS